MKRREFLTKGLALALFIGMPYQANPQELKGNLTIKARYNAETREMYGKMLNGNKEEVGIEIRVKDNDKNGAIDNSEIDTIYSGKRMSEIFERKAPESSIVTDYPFVGCRIIVNSDGKTFTTEYPDLIIKPIEHLYNNIEREQQRQRDLKQIA